MDRALTKTLLFASAPLLAVHANEKAYGPANGTIAFTKQQFACDTRI